MSEQHGVTYVEGRISLGDYSNGRFCVRAGYDISRVEHDAEGISVILEVPEGDKVFGHHVHLNLSADVLRRLARDHELARSEGDYYPGRQAGSTAVPEETPDERVVRINEALGYAAAAQEHGHDGVETVRLDRAAYNRGYSKWFAEHPEWARP